MKVTTTRHDARPSVSLAIHDGIAAERFRHPAGKSVVARLGAELRHAFVHFVHSRLQAGAQPAFVFHIFDSEVTSIHADWRTRTKLPVDELENAISTLDLDRIVEVMSIEPPRLEQHWRRASTSR